MDRQIIHLDLDSFFVSVERLQNSQLLGKPVIVGGTSDRGVVAACSYEARRFGVHSAMPMKLARRLCPHAVYIKGDHDQYTKYSKEVTEIIADRAPVYEKASIDEHYIDLTGMDKFFGCMKWSQELRKTITKETGLPISFGLSINKTVSKMATDESKPAGEKEVPKEKVKEFLDPLPVNKLPMIGPKTASLLKSMGVYTIRSLGDIPLDMLIKVMGDNGRIAWQRANGIDFSKVEPYSERKSISEEETFDKDTTDIRKLEDTLLVMAENLAFKLRVEKRLASTITVKIRYSDFNTYQQQCTVCYTAADHILIPKIKELFYKLYNKRMLIRLIGLKLSGLVAGHYQADIFEDTAEMLNLYQAIDKMKIRFGEDAVFKGTRLK